MMRAEEQRVSGTCEQLLAQFAAAQVSDKWAERRKKVFLGWIIGCCVLGFVGPFLAPVHPIFVALLPLGLIAALVLGRVRARYNRYDLDDRKLATVTLFLQVTAADMLPEQPVQVVLDLRDYHKGGQAVLPPRTAPRDRQSKQFAHAWLRLASRFADGTAYAFTVMERVRRRERRKRKYTKVKEKIRATITLRLRLPLRHGSAEPVAAALAQLAPPSGLTVRSVVAKERTLVAVCRGAVRIRVQGRYGSSIAVPGHEVTGDTLLQLLLWAYRGLASTRVATSEPASLRELCTT